MGIAYAGIDREPLAEQRLDRQQAEARSGAGYQILSGIIISNLGGQDRAELDRGVECFRQPRADDGDRQDFLDRVDRGSQAQRVRRVAAHCGQASAPIAAKAAAMQKAKTVKPATE